MGALLSQAVANQLRQFPQSQDPRPSPPVLLQQVLNPPGPSMPTWMGPTMERQQLLALNTPETNRAAAQDALRMAMAFGGADITKEQKLQWEKENEEYRAAQQKKGLAQHQLSPGTRVAMRPWGVRTGEPTSVYGPGKLQPPNEGDMAGGTGVIVTPGTAEAGTPAGVAVRRDPVTGKSSWDVKNANRPPSPHHVAVRGEQSGHWFWRHRDSLEILPPLEKFPVGTKVQWEYRGKTWTGTVGEIPRSGHDKEYWHDQKKHIWIDTDVGPDEKPLGGWLPPEWLTKRGK